MILFTNIRRELAFHVKEPGIPACKQIFRLFQVHGNQINDLYEPNYDRRVLFSCLATWITTDPFSILQLILSPFLRSNLFTIDTGTVVRNELLFEVAGWRTDSSCPEDLAIVMGYLGMARIYRYLRDWGVWNEE